MYQVGELSILEWAHEEFAYLSTLNYRFKEKDFCHPLMKDIFR